MTLHVSYPHVQPRRRQHPRSATWRSGPCRPSTWRPGFRRRRGWTFLWARPPVRQQRQKIEDADGAVAEIAHEHRPRIGLADGASQLEPTAGGRAAAAAVDSVPGEVEVASADRRDSRTSFIFSCVGNRYPAWTTSRALHGNYALRGPGGSPCDDSPARSLRLTPTPAGGNGCFARTVGGRCECSIGSRVHQRVASPVSFWANGWG